MRISILSKRLLNDEQGVASLLVGLAMVAIMGLAAMAIDLGSINLKRSQLQTAADAAALAAANSLLAEGSDLDQLRRIATVYGARNLDESDKPSAALTDADIIFLKDGSPTMIDPNQVEVSVRRTADRGNPLSMSFGSIVGVPTADVVATSRAGIVGMCSSKCVKPFIVPTKFTWDDKAAPPASKYYNNGEMDAESPEEVASVVVIGYDESDLGTTIVIKPGDPQLAISPGQYNLVDLPPANKGNPITGADAVNENIAGCTGSNSQVAVAPGDELLLEPGNSKGPVSSGVEDLISQDPYAYWDTTNNSIENSMYDDPMDSPRVCIMMFYDPSNPPVSGRNTIFVYQLGAFFVENVDSKGNVSAKFIQTVAVDPDSQSDDSCLLSISRVLLDSSRE